MVDRLSLESKALDDAFVVGLPNGDKIVGNRMLADFPITIEGRDFNAELIIIPLMPQDLILGMDWMIRHGAVLDFNRRVVTISSDGKFVCKFRGRLPSDEGREINMIQAARLLGQDCTGFICYLESADETVSTLSDIPIVQDFPDVFPDEIPGLPPRRFVEFNIDLEPGTSPLSKAPYRMAPLEMKELKK